MIAKLINENLKLFVSFDLLILSCLIFSVFRYKSLVLDFLLWMRRYMIEKVVKKINSTLLIFVCITFFFLALLALYFPLGVDESYTFLNFSQKGIYASLCTYPVPNNHVLLSFISNFFYPISKFLDSPELIRLASLSIAFIHTLLVCSFLKNNFGIYRAVAFLSFLLLLPPILLYSFELRGYGLFIFSGSMLSILYFYKSNHKYFHLLNTILHFIGFASNPSWLYSYLIFNALIWVSQLNNRRFLWNSFICQAYLIASLILFYSPIIIFYGADSIVNNPYVKAVPDFKLFEVWNSLKNYYFYFCGSSFISTVLLSAIFFISLFKSKKKYLLLILPVGIALIMIVFRQYPFERIFVGVLSFLLLFTIIHFPKLPIPNIFFSSLLLIAIGIFASFHITHYSFFIDTRMTQVQKYLEMSINEKKVSEIYLSKGDLILNNLIVEYQWTKSNIKIIPCNSLLEVDQLISGNSIHKLIIHSDLYSRWPSPEGKGLFSIGESINSDYRSLIIE